MRTTQALILIPMWLLAACVIGPAEPEPGSGGSDVGGCGPSSDASTSYASGAPYDEDCEVTLCNGGACVAVELTGYACGVSGNCFHGSCLEPI